MRRFTRTQWNAISFISLMNIISNCASSATLSFLAPIFNMKWSINWCLTHPVAASLRGNCRLLPPAPSSLISARSYFHSPLPTELKNPVDPKHPALRRESLPLAPGRWPRRRNSICGSHLSVLCSAEINTTSSGMSPEDASPPELFDVLSKQTLWLCWMSEPPFAASCTLLPAPPLLQPKACGGLPPFGGHLSSRRRLIGNGIPYVGVFKVSWKQQPQQQQQKRPFWCFANGWSWMKACLLN